VLLESPMMVMLSAVELVALLVLVLSLGLPG
jgi:hypothetical protein